MKLTILPSAREDLDAGYGFYESQQAGLGNYFWGGVFSDIDELRAVAGHHRKVFGFHRHLTKTFPYAIYYSITGDEVCIRAVLDCRSDPRSIRRQLSK